MVETGSTEILKWFDEALEECGFDIDSNPHYNAIKMPDTSQEVELKIEPIEKEEEEPDVKIDIPDKAKEIAKGIQAMRLIDSIQNHLKFYASSPSDDMMNKENLVKKIQGMIEELSNMVGSL